MPPQPKPGYNPSFGASTNTTGAAIESDYNNSTTGYISGVQWKDESGNTLKLTSKFVAGKRYTVTVSVLRKSEGYEFSSSTKGYINYNTGTVSSWGGVAISVNLKVSYTFTCTATKITSAGLTGVPTPAAGTYPVYTGISVTGTGYHIDTTYDDVTRRNGIAWVDTNINKMMKSTEVFEAGHVYTINVILASNTGYEFAVSGSSPDVTVKFGGKEATGTNSVSGKEPSRIMAAWYTFPALEATGFKVSGSMTSYISDSDKITIGLYKSGSEIPAYSKIVNGNANSYSVDNVAPGSYTMKVSKKNHVDREYAVTVNGANVTQDVKICPIGDANNDGKVNAKDSNAIMRHISKASILTGYNLACANANGDTKVNAKDVNRILRHISKAEPLF